ncbi:MAG: ABC transporter substrate-binding protein [bacterium]|nr:ABC transporter substrate-binding protein [bacterium]
MNITFKQASYAVLLIIIVLGAVYSVYNFGGQNQPAPAVKNYKIGLLMINKDVGNDNLNGFKSKFETLGYKEGVNVEYIIRNAGADRDAILKAQSAEMNSVGVDIILAFSTTVLEPLIKLPDFKTKTYFLAAGRPRDIVKNLQAPEGLITGIGEGTVEFAGKRVSLLKEMAPSIKTVISIVEKNHGNAPLFKENVNKAAQELGLNVVFIDIEKPDDILKALPQLVRKLGDAYIACPCQSNEKYAKELAAQLLKAKIVSINPEITIGAKIGFLATYSDDRYKTGEYAATKIDEILKGKPISQVPVEFAKDVLFELNLATAKAIGITLPETIISRANKIYNE